MLSKSENVERKTPYTVEAISIEKGKWIGINQTKINRYVEFFLEKGQLEKLCQGKLNREIKLGKSRIDFLVGETYLEVKMPLIEFPSKDEIKNDSMSKFNSFDRLIKHFDDLGKITGKKKAIILLCFIYDARPFSPPKIDPSNRIIQDAAKKAVENGVENWQLNLRIDKKSVEILKYFKLDLFERKIN